MPLILREYLSGTERLLSKENNTSSSSGQSREAKKTHPKEGIRMTVRAARLKNPETALEGKKDREKGKERSSAFAQADNITAHNCFYSKTASRAPPTWRKACARPSSEAYEGIDEGLAGRKKLL